MCVLRLRFVCFPVAACEQNLSDKNKMQVALHHSGLKHLCINRPGHSVLQCCGLSLLRRFYSFSVVILRTRKNHQVAEVKEFGDCDSSLIFWLRNTLIH